MKPTDRLVVNPRYDVELVPPTTAILLNEVEHLALQGAFAVEVMQRCSSPVSVAELRVSLEGRYTALELLGGLTHLVERGHLVDATPRRDHDGARFWARSGLDVAPGGELAVALHELGCHSAHALRASLADLSLEVLAAGDTNAALDVVVVDDYLQPELERVNADQLARGRRWALVKLAGVVPWIGPLLVPGESACWACLAARLRDNRQVESYLRRRRGGDDVRPRPVSVPASLTAAAGLAALALVRWLHDGEHAEAGMLTTLDTRDLTSTKHCVTQLTHCQACGTAPARATPRIALDDGRPVRGDDDGGLRTETPEATVARLAHHVSPLTGLVSRIDEYDTGGELITVHRAVHPLFTPRGDLDSLRESLESTTAGKGRSSTQSRASALCEALERSAGRFEGHETDRRAAWSGLREEAVHPSRLLHFSARQYEAREAWNAQHSGFAWVPERFADERPIDWTAAWSLTAERPVLLPTAYCYYNAPLEPGHAFCAADSNGCAAGSTLGEAVLQGFLELVERDAVAIWWYNRLTVAGLDLDSVEDPLLDRTREAYADRNRELWVLDVTSDLGVPTFVAASRRHNHREEIVQGYGAHFDPKIALWRAITEMSQMLAHLGDTDLDMLEDPDLGAWYGTARLAQHPCLAPGPARANAWTPRHERERSLERELERCVALMRSHGLELLVLDQTRPDVDLRVVKVVVPGLRHFWPRFAAGRLYDVPVAMGRLPQPLREEQLNPIPICT
jgi:ribosomal protein S12 methylthiotransferase accessory factor